jgi:hypothetical protein
MRAYQDTRDEGYDVVVDYLWGRPTEILLRALTPESFAFPKPTRLIQVGEAAGGDIKAAWCETDRHGRRLVALPTSPGFTASEQPVQLAGEGD